MERPQSLRSEKAAVVGLLVVAALLSLRTAPPSGSMPDVDSTRTGRELYEYACAACHGADGRGAAVAMVGFATPLPDFTDCSFATREPDADWLAVAHEGGRVRGFGREMPAFGKALSVEEIQKTLDHIRGLCSNDAWPRGELNLPRPLVTEKAYPEDEALVSTNVDVENNRAVTSEVVYEKRFGARNQIEIVVPFGAREESGGWTGGRLGDVALGVKRAFYHSLQRGSIFSLGGEIILPTGDRDAGFGKGTVIVEPFTAFGQLLPAGGFLHLQGGAELPLDRSEAGEEIFFRGVIGKSLTQGRWGRTWSPMVEVLGSRELAGGAETHLDVVPQMQVTLSTRQHVMLNVGVRLPLDDPARDAEVMVYLLWDWYDGGLFEGW